MADVLFGRERMEASSEGSTRAARMPDGWFGSQTAPRRQNVSAVLVFPSADVWCLAEPRGQPLLVRHPWTASPLTRGLLPVNEFIIDEQGERTVLGRSMADILGLPDPWPPI